MRSQTYPEVFNQEVIFASRVPVLIVLLAVGLISSGCQTKKYVLHGEVISTNPPNSEITVKHEDIPGFMPAMTMAYKVKDPAMVQELKPGNVIVGDLVTKNNGNDYRLQNIRITSHSTPHTMPVARTHFLAPGEHVPDLPLVNQDGKTLHLDDFQGKAVLMTFIYTRCPLPDFCPRLSGAFAKIHRDFAKFPDDYKKTHLLIVSFDSKYDTPTVLRKYGLAYLDNAPSGFSHWDFASMESSDLRKLADAFGLENFEEENEIVHTMDVVLINPDGRIAKYWANQWTAEELEDAFATGCNFKRSCHTSWERRGSTVTMRLVLGSLSFVFAGIVLLGCSRAGDDRAAHGKALFELYCAGCHEGTNPELLRDPPRLHHLFMNKTLPSGASADDKHVRQTIVQGRGIMPPFGLTLKQRDIDDLLKYLHTL